MSSSDTESAPAVVAEVAPAAVAEGQLDLTPNKDGGVLKEILKAGSGTEGPMTGDIVSVHYVGTLLEDGSQFDSSRERGDQFTFTLGKGQVIKAWDIGVASMVKGELCRLTCRSDYAYGDAGSPPKIPGGATLIFEVELFSWHGEDLSSGDKGVLRSVITPGEGFDSPNDGAWVKVAIKASVNGVTVDERTVEFSLGEGEEVNIPNGIELALLQFKKKESSLLKLSPSFAFGSAGNSSIGVPADSPMEYVVTLEDFEKTKESFDMTLDEKLDAAKVHKDKGTKHFTAGKYRMAIKQYEKVTDLLEYEEDSESERLDENKAMWIACQLNQAAAYLKLEDYVNAKDCATTVLKFDKNNVKAYFRRGTAYQHMKFFTKEAIADFKKCISLDPANGAAKKQLAQCNAVLKQQNQQEKKLYSGMFEKFARSDANRAAAARKNGVLKDGVGEWDENNAEEETDGDLSEVKLLSSAEEIKADEFMSTS